MYVPLILLLHMTEKKSQRRGGWVVFSPHSTSSFHACMYTFIHTSLINRDAGHSMFIVTN